MKILISFYSMSGNTMELAEFIADNLKGQGHEVTLFDIMDNREVLSPLNYDIFLLGTFSWDMGKVPQDVKDYMLKVEVEDVYIFGTGDSQFGEYYNKAAINLAKYYKSPYEPLLIEQRITIMNQKEKTIKWLEGMMTKWKNKKC